MPQHRRGLASRHLNLGSGPTTMYNWSFRKSLLSIVFFLAVVGGTSLAIGAFMPAYTDQAAANRIRSGSECERGVPNTNENSQCDSKVWHRSMNGIRTDKWQLVDLGAGFLASALSLFIFTLWNGWRPWREIATPRRMMSILVLVSIAWFMQIPAYVTLILTEVSRDYLPWWADSVAIPMMQVQNVVLTLSLPYLALWLCFIVGSRLPALIFSRVSGRPVVNVFWTVAAALLSVPIGLTLMGAILEGPVLMVPFLWLTLWLALCARAAALTRHAPKRAVTEPVL